MIVVLLLAAVGAGGYWLGTRSRGYADSDGVDDIAVAARAGQRSVDDERGQVHDGEEAGVAQPGYRPIRSPGAGVPGPAWVWVIAMVVLAVLLLVVLGPLAGPAGVFGDLFGPGMFGGPGGVFGP